MPSDPGPMTLGNMQANGVRILAGRASVAAAITFAFSMSAYPDDVPVPLFDPRLRYEICGHHEANARPNWNEMHRQKPVTQASEGPLCLQ